MILQFDDEPGLRQLVAAIVSDDEPASRALLAGSSALARAAFERGATRAVAVEYYLNEIQHYVYAGDTALHVAAAAHRPGIARALIDFGSDLSARNRRGAQPLHYAADGVPVSASWNPERQAQTITLLIAAGADPNATDKSGVTPLLRAVRTRCAAAVQALLDGGADPRRPNNNGSTPMLLATIQSGRGSSASPEGRTQQAEIIRILERAGGSRP